MPDQRPDEPGDRPPPPGPEGWTGQGPFHAPGHAPGPAPGSAPGSAGRPPGAPPPRPWEQGGEWENQPGGQPYPRQHLLPQEIRPGRNRTPLLIALGVVLALVIGGSIAFLVLRDDGEDTRAAYCASLRDLTDNGDITSAMGNADESTLDDVAHLMDLAPKSVADDWETLDRGITRAQSGSPDMSEALSIFSALKAIASDAQDNCNLDLGIPFS